MKNCPNCGHQNPDDARFCETCGAALSSNVQQHFNTSPSDTGSSEGANIGLGILSFLIPLVGIILGISYMSNPAKKAAGKTYLFLGIGGLVLGCLFAALIGSAGGDGY
jgi:uncharacterized membrane protein YvbJ